MRILVEATDVTPEVEAAVEQTVDWFDGSPTMGTQEFIDRLCNTYGGDDFDLESYDNPAVRRIMRLARQHRADRA